MGVREFIWGVIGLIAVYVAIQLLRLGRRQGSANAVPATPPAAVEGAPDAASAEAEAGPGGFPDRLAELEAGLRAEHERADLELQQLRRDVAQLRTEQESLRRDNLSLTERLAELGDGLAAVQASQHVSPQYGEAVMLARRGLQSEAIAERCGISVAEAALVRSLSASDEAGAEEGRAHGE
ncbi:MAG: DUF2802 domain-containing protein [Rhodocyclaceae bacterium]|nr:DUF2802 domain-containing protein [Rhodocyclaceae bacterium]